jgi:tetratricopeptide (TPR) repeat protein
MVPNQVTTYNPLADVWVVFQDLLARLGEDFHSLQMNKPGKKTAMISSTSIDLPLHRDEVVQACLRQGVFPIGMEQLPARDADAVRVSMEMVDQADIYIGIFAWRYGYKPKGHDISITEMEFNRAVERKIPILVFLIHDEHSLTIAMVETDKDAQRKLAELKDRAKEGRGRREFKSPEELRGEVIHALSDLQKREQESPGEKAVPDFHPPNFIPQQPEPYIAHPYSLLQTKDVVGRQAELNLLTDWVTKNEQVPAGTRIFNLVAIGGMGKSALTWKWFNDIAPNELPKLAGRMWWSFYESDAHWENFIIRALAYVSGQSEKKVRELKSPEREEQLWHILDRQPFLLVLDGLERILIAYARMDAAQMLDEDLDEKTANWVTKAIGLPPSAADSFIGKQPLRLTADHRAGQFLRRLARIKNSRLLITTRLYPINLQAETGDPLPGCAAQFLSGLTDSDALNLWREFKVSGSAEQLQPLFRSFGNYPLLIRALAGEVARYRSAPRDFDRWRTENRKFDPTHLPLKNAKTHVLEYALRGLPVEHRKVLHTIAAFRMPATWDTLRALLVEQGQGPQTAVTPISRSKVQRSKVRSGKPCRTDLALDRILTELEDRGLVGWDKKSNRYDLHPIVRGVVWQTLDGQSREGIYSDLRTYFDAVPRPPEYLKVESIEDLTSTIELYQSLIGLERYNDAFALFRDHLESATLYRLSASRQRAELLECLFPDGTDKPPRLQATEQGFALNSLALAYQYRGEPGRAVPLFRRAVEGWADETQNVAIAFTNLSAALRSSGELRHADSASRRAIRESRKSQYRYPEWMGEYLRGLSLAVCGFRTESAITLNRSLKMGKTNPQDRRPEGENYADMAERLLWFRNPKSALSFAQQAWKLAKVPRFEADFIRAARLHGSAALCLDDLEIASERLQYALSRARAVNLAEEELPTLSALAELHRRKQEFSTSRELLEQIWDLAERGPYPLFHADALNVLAQIERDEGNREAAIVAATKAYLLAWCDGPPYAYHYGLTNARDHLEELRAPEPQLPPFDESQFEPMPDVELNPKDEFWVDPDKLDD